MSVLTLISDLLLGAGVLLVITGTLGLLRLPDFFTRTHGASITDSAGAGLILIALLFRVEDFATGLRLMLILAFLLFTSPTASHALAQAALQDGLKPKQRRPGKGS